MAWNDREASYPHHFRFEQLLELHHLTEAWIDALRQAGADRPSHALDRGLSREITDQLWMLGSLDPRGLESLLDDTSPEDVLGRLERTVWSVQSYTLAKLLERTHDEETRVLRSVLEQTSWKSGRNCAEKRWGILRPATRRSMRRLVLTLNDTPFGGSPDCSGFLMTRVTDHEARFDLLRCAHQSSHNEVRLVADELCAFHSHWLKGFAYGLNPAVQVETARENGRCRNRWVLSDHAVARSSPEALSP
jgi:hypothetical protein